MSATARKVPCGFCGDLITSYDDANPKGTPRKYCDRHCRNEAKKQRHREKMYSVTRDIALDTIE